jgi:hypothetical protein
MTVSGSGSATFAGLVSMAGALAVSGVGTATFAGSVTTGPETHAGALAVSATGTATFAATASLFGAVALSAAGAAAFAATVAGPYSPYVRFGENWRVPTTYVKTAGSWVQPLEGWVFNSGIWRRFL